MVISVRNKDAFKEEIIFHLTYTINNAIFSQNYFNENIHIFCYRWVSSGVKTHRMFILIGLSVISSMMILFQ